MLLALRSLWGLWLVSKLVANERGLARSQCAPMAHAEPAAGPAVDDAAREGWLVFGSGDSIQEEVVVRKYAPDFLHWVGDSVHVRHLDGFGHIGFDEESDDPRGWVGDDNWDHADSFKERIAATVYGGVVAITENQMYIVYYYFHPRDYVDRWWESGVHWLGVPFGLPMYHENDLEGGMLIVDRRGGNVIHVVALYHNKFDQRHLCQSDGASCWDEGRLGDAIVWVEAAGHGAHLVAVADIAELEWNRGQFTRYSIAPDGTRERQQ